MALDRTAGFDMLVQISERELNDQFATMFLAGSLFPPTMILSVNSGGIVGTATLNFNTPVLDLDQPSPNVGITIPFVNSQLQVTSPATIAFAPLGGEIVIVDRVEMIKELDNQMAVIDFVNEAPDVTVRFDDRSKTILAPALAATGKTIGQVENTFSGIVLQQLQANIRQIPLSTAISVADDTDPTTVYDIDVTTVNDQSAVDQDCITFGVRMANDSGGNINGVTSSFIPTGSQNIIMMSNFWLLARVMRPRLADSLRTAVTNFDTPLRLNRSVPAPGGKGTLTRLEGHIESNRIRIDGQITASGTGWSAVSDFNFFIDLAIGDLTNERGERVRGITVTATTPSVNTDVDLEWWVWVVSLGLGALFGGITGVVVAAIVDAIVLAVADGIVNNMVGGGVGNSLGGIPGIPLGPIGGGLAIGSLLLDDLELRCSIVRSVSIPILSQGSNESLGGFTVDLDTGEIRNNAVLGTDLIWDTSRGFIANGSAGLTITGTKYDSLTPAQISMLPLDSREIPSTLIPVIWFPPIPFLWQEEVVFGIRTSGDKLAKVRAWRSMLAGGALQMSWTTYDTPVPQLEIAARWSIVERGTVTGFIASDCSQCRSSTVRWRGLFEARPRLMAFPIDYQWCLCGEVIKEGKGTVNSMNGLISYKLTANRLLIESQLGQNIDCELCISGIDSAGREQFTCVKLSKHGVDTQCKPCVPGSPYVTVVVAEVAASLRSWRQLSVSGVVSIVSSGILSGPDIK